MRISALIAGLALCALSQAGVAGDDAAGCKDTPLLTRLPGCHISYCSKSEFDQAELMTKIGAPTKHLEGRIEKIHYECDGKSALQVRRNAEGALKGAGYAIDFTGYDVPTHFVTAHKGAQWVAVQANEMTDACSYDVTTVLTEEMKQEMASNADIWAGEIAKTGHVAVYGIEFDVAKATLRPDAEKVLADVLALLNTHKDLRLKIEGHTDSTGTKTGNITLSQQRAAAVVAWLVKKGVSKTRLASAGKGDTQPVADNISDAGRAKNRRVELVKI
jgi:outer membrane protein OmpA-like peptidoglycan-associated protein